MCVLTIDEIKAAVTPVAAKYGLETVYLFGSYARGEATDDSDVDLLIDGYKEKALLYGVMIEDFKDNLKKNVDVIAKSSFKYYTDAADNNFQYTITMEALPLYEQR